MLAHSLILPVASSTPRRCSEGCSLAAGIAQTERAVWERLLSPFQILPWTPEVAWRHGQLYRYLADQGLLVGANDLWIAATAVAHGLPLVTAADRRFSRVPGLDVRRYR